ncbi:hypothetical protein SAVIM338S_00276 [Streptomyces avidinii]
MRITSRTMRTAIIAAMAAALSLGAASGALAASGSPAPAAVSAKTDRVFVKTVKLSQGYTAALFRVADGYTAEISSGGRYVATVTALGDSTTGTSLRGLTVQLTSRGAITTTADDSRPLPRPQDERVFVRSERVGPYLMAKVYRTGDRYEAVISGEGVRTATLTANGSTTAKTVGGLRIVLHADGGLTAYAAPAA